MNSYTKFADVPTPTGADVVEFKITGKTKVFIKKSDESICFRPKPIRKTIRERIALIKA